MAKNERFTFLCDKNERALIAVLAERLRRSQSDAVRFLVVEAAKELNADAMPQRDVAQKAVESANALAAPAGG